MPVSAAQDVIVVEYHKLVECSGSDRAATEDQVLLAQQIQQVRVLLALKRTVAVSGFCVHIALYI